MDQKPCRVSIVIPCYNGGQWLAGAIRSARDQEEDGISVDVIVVDDGSTDPQTLDLLDNLPEGIRLHRQANAGLPAARNAGLRLATGDYLLPLDCDDELKPGFLRAGLDRLEANPALAFVFSRLELTGEATGVLDKTYNAFDQLFLNQLPYCLLMRHSTYEAADGYDETMRDGYEDWEFNIRLGGLGLHGEALDKAYFVYRVAAGGMLQAKSRQLHAQLWAAIQKRNRARYQAGALFDCWRRWGTKAYPLPLVLGLYLFHKAVPAALFNRVFALALSRSHSERASRRN
ncbi:MAG: glycosyltransferase family 2 protein [Rhodospirillales bacterium]